MSEKEFARIIASALMMIMRAINRRYGLELWILTRDEKRKLRSALLNGDPYAIMRIFDGVDNVTKKVYNVNGS